MSGEFPRLHTVLKIGDGDFVEFERFYFRCRCRLAWLSRARCGSPLCVAAGGSKCGIECWGDCGGSADESGSKEAAAISGEFCASYFSGHDSAFLRTKSCQHASRRT